MISREAQLDQFLATNPAYTREKGVQAGQGATNFIAFLRYKGERIVAKVFGEEERKQRECFALRHWENTGLVPAVIADDAPLILLTSWLPGAMLQAHDNNPSQQDDCRAVGNALGTLTQIPLSTLHRLDFEARFYQDTPSLESYLGRIVALGRGIVSRDPEFSDRFWHESLDGIEEQIRGILEEPRILYHQDASNLHVQRGRFLGFFDLEMSRVGCASMQLASALGMLGGNANAWKSFREGWETSIGLPLDDRAIAKASAAYQLLGWREISRYLSYDGTLGVGYSWASPADPDLYRRQFIAGDELMRRSTLG